MAYQNQKHHNYRWDWRPHIYQVYEPTVEPAYPKHHQKGRGAFRTTNYEYEEAIAEAESYVDARETEIQTAPQRTRFGDQNGYESVDQEAEAFIQHEHRRMELARLMSSMK